MTWSDSIALAALALGCFNTWQAWRRERLDTRQLAEDREVRRIDKIEAEFKEQFFAYLATGDEIHLVKRLAKEGISLSRIKELIVATTRALESPMPKELSDTFAEKYVAPARGLGFKE